MRIILLFSVILAAAAASTVDNNNARIIGGTLTTINNYPFMISLQARQANNNFMHQCGGTLINNRAVLSAAHCFIYNSHPSVWRGRVGSSFILHSGAIHEVLQIIRHPAYIPPAINVDIAIVRIQGQFNWIPNAVQAGSIAGPNYHVADNQPVWAVGWGVTETGTLSEQLRQVQLFIINQNVCRQRWAAVNINNSMLCNGRLDQNGFGTCQADSGGPLLHNNVVVGVTSFGSWCGNGAIPLVSARVSYVSDWVRLNA